MSHWFYNIIGFGGSALPAPVAELGRKMLRVSIGFRIVALFLVAQLQTPALTLGADPKALAIHVKSPLIPDEAV